MNNPTDLVIICHNIRSTHNIGSILRTADGFGIKKVVVTGISPYPQLQNDSRLPHIKLKLTNQISKTALGAEKTISIQHFNTLQEAIADLKSAGYKIVGLEQGQQSILLNSYKPQAKKIALVLGPEVTGFTQQDLNLMDEYIEIPMSGSKESFNVSVAAGVAIYHLKFGANNKC